MNPLASPVLIIFSGLLPLLIALLKQWNWSPQQNAMVAFASYIVVGVLAALVNGAPVTTDPTSVIQWIAAVTLYGRTAYELVWTNLGKSSDSAMSIDERVTKATSVTGN
jgi:hypothetical protein